MLTQFDPLLENTQDTFAKNIDMSMRPPTAPSPNPLAIQHHQAQAHAAALEGMPPVNSSRMGLLPPHLASRINAFNESLRAKGMDVIDLGMGNPVDPVAENVVEKLKDALNDPH